MASSLVEESLLDTEPELVQLVEPELVELVERSDHQLPPLPEPLVEPSDHQT